VKRAFFFIFTFLFSHQLFAAQVKYKPLSCHGKKWSSPRKHDPAFLHKKFDKISRPDLTQMLWYELSQRPQNDLALPMLQYLIHTEKSKDFKSYYEVLGAAAYNTNVPVNTLYSEYPKKNQKIKNKKINVIEICKLYNKTAQNL
jgi:hypothetical protein